MVWAVARRVGGHPDQVARLYLPSSRHARTPTRSRSLRAVGVACRRRARCASPREGRNAVKVLALAHPREPTISGQPQKPRCAEPEIYPNPSATVARCRPEDMGTRCPLSVVLVGAGGMAYNHARVLSSCPSTRLALVVDVDAERAEKVAAEAGCEAAIELGPGLGTPLSSRRHRRPMRS